MYFLLDKINKVKTRPWQGFFKMNFWPSSSCEMEIKLILIHFNVQSLRIEGKLKCFVKIFAKCMGFDKTIGVVLICYE